MGVLPTSASNNLLPLHSQNQSSESGKALPVQNPGMCLSLEQVSPLLRGVNIPVMPVQRIYHRSDLRQLPIQYPCRLRVPVRGSIGIAVANRIDAIAACQTLFSRKVNGAFPSYLLVEAKRDWEHQVHLMVMLDKQLNGTALWSNNSPGNNDTQALKEAWQQGEIADVAPIANVEKMALPKLFNVEDGKLLAIQLGLKAAKGPPLVHLLEKLYLMMTWTGMTRCWLDALSLPTPEQATVLAGEFVFDAQSPLKHQAQAALKTGSVIDSARLSHRLLARKDTTDKDTAEEPLQPAAIAANEATAAAEPQAVKFAAPHPLPPPRIVRLGEGNMAVIGNGFSRTMNTLEHVQLRGGSVAAFINFPGNSNLTPDARDPEILSDSNLPRMAWTDGSLFQDVAPKKAGAHQTHSPGNTSNPSIPGNPGPPSSELDAFSLKRQLGKALHALDHLRTIRVILINWRGTQLPCRIVADALVEYQRRQTQQARRSGQPLSLVVRLTGKGADSAYQRLLGEEVETEDDLDGAIARSMGLARISSRW